MKMHDKTVFYKDVKCKVQILKTIFEMNILQDDKTKSRNQEGIQQ